MSTNAYYYRYKVNAKECLSMSTHDRRVQKAKQNTTTILLYDFTDFREPIASGFNLKSSFKTQFLIRPDQFHYFKQYDISPASFIIQLANFDDIQFLKKNSKQFADETCFLFAPRTTDDFEQLLDLKKLNIIADANLFWDFKPYNPQLKKGLTLKSIHSKKVNFKRLPGLELWNTQIPENYELEPIQQIAWSLKTPRQNILISFIIPSFNNIIFLSNVIQHLIKQNLPAENFEIIVVEDGGTDKTSPILYELLRAYEGKINLKMIYWSKLHTEKGAQNFFRAGLARNLATQFAESDLFFFLDSDILTPPEFAKTCLSNLEKFDLIQFERHHIKQSLSLLNPQFNNVHLAKDTYIEEAGYWSKLFTSPQWMDLPNYWKYTCTYALGMKKSDFLDVGRFKKYYVSYGFEDTDLGYEFFLRNKKVHLVQTPLLHLTAYDQMQYKNSQLKRLQLLRKTAALFYLQHLDSAIYKDFGNFYSFEKPLLSSVRDFF